MSFEQATFKALKTLYAADSGGGGLVELLRPGGFIHTSERAKSRSVPRVEFSMTGQLADDSSGTRFDSTIGRLSVFVKRDLAFGTGDTPETGGQLESIIDRIETVFNGVKPTVSGWTFGTLGRIRVIPGPEDAETVHRVVEFNVHGEKS